MRDKSQVVLPLDLKNAIQSRAPKNVKVEQITNDGVNGEYLSKGNNPEDKVFMYIHGGGFVGGSPAARRAFTGYTAKKLGYNVYSVDYRLAPEYAFPFGAESRCSGHSFHH